MGPSDEPVLARLFNQGRPSPNMDMQQPSSTFSDLEFLDEDEDPNLKNMTSARSKVNPLSSDFKSPCKNLTGLNKEFKNYFRGNYNQPGVRDFDNDKFDPRIQQMMFNQLCGDQNESTHELERLHFNQIEQISICQSNP